MLAWIIRYPFAITTQVLQNHDSFISQLNKELQVHGKMIEPNKKIS